VDSHDPKRLIETLHRLCPEEAQEVDRKDEVLRTKEDQLTRAQKQPNDRS
jgi:hypothetical protein